MTKRILDEKQLADLNSRNRQAWKDQAEGKPVPPAAAAKIKKAKPRYPSETAECRAFIEWTEFVTFKGRPLRERVVKIPNERGKAGPQTAILTAIGMEDGFLDYVLLVPAGRWHGLFIEAKKLKGGNKTDTDQLRWVDLLIEFGYHAEICEGAIAMIAAVKAYFERAGCVTDGSFIDRTQVQL